MASLFLSYSGTDAPLVERRDRLRAQGFAALFVAYDAAEGIPAGRRWERELYVELRRADAVVFLASPASVVSRWCFAELTLARSIGKPVFPVRVSAGVELSLLDDVQWIELRSEDDEEGYERLWQGLRGAGLFCRRHLCLGPHPLALSRLGGVQLRRRGSVLRPGTGGGSPPRRSLN